MRFLFLIIIIACLVSAFVAVFVVPAEDRRALVAVIRDQIPGEWIPVDWLSGDWLPADLLTPVTLDPGGQPMTPAASDAIERIQATSGEAIGDWIYDCPATLTDGRDCTLSQQVSDADGAVAFSWVISIDPMGRFSAKWQVATGIMVNRGIVLDAGTPQPIRLPYAFCVSGYCEASANLAEDFVTTLSTITGATATVQPVEGQALFYVISTRGLADGLRTMRAAAARS